MRIEIDGAAIRSESDLHEFLSRALDFGPYYGANLSALWDRLSTDVERPVEIVWKESELSRTALGESPQILQDHGRRAGALHREH
ncbi:barstar family protein, partial [Streptomyces sp. NPDC001215]